MTLTVVSGPPCSGKSTYVAERVNAGEVVIDFDTLAAALFPGYADHDVPDFARQFVADVRGKAIDALIRSGRSGWVIDSDPPDWLASKLRTAGARFVPLDPGLDECVRRSVANGRPVWTEEIIRGWYSRHKPSRALDFFA